MSKLIEFYKAKAKLNKQTIVLPEGEEPRIIKAAEIITKEGFADIILLGDKAVMQTKCPEVCLDGIKIVNPKTDEKLDDYAALLYELRKTKGMTMEEAINTAQYMLYHGVLMVKAGDADGMVGGAIHSTGDLLRPALQIIKTSPGISTVSGYFLMETPLTHLGTNGVFLFADCGVNPNPDTAQLADIAIASASSARHMLGEEPRVAMISFSTKGSAKHQDVDKVRNATQIAMEKAPELAIDGELQIDTAIVPAVAKLKAPESKVAGKANVFVFPDLDAGNAAYKLVQYFGGANAFGPICQGMAKPVNDLSRGCTVDDVVGVVAITACQAIEMKK